MKDVGLVTWSQLEKAQKAGLPANRCVDAIMAEAKRRYPSYTILMLRRQAGFVVVASPEPGR